MTKTRKQFGLWSSPISPLSLARSGSINDLAWAADGTLVWLEGRGDRSALVVRPPDGQAERDLNSDFSSRGRVGYGGGAFGLGAGQVVFVEAASGRLYRQPWLAGAASPLTPAFGKAASPVVSPDGRWVVFVHSHEEQDCLAVVDLAGQHWPARLASGHDFYMQPVWRPDGGQIAFIAWDHPNMPWDDTGLYLADVQFPLDGLPTLSEPLLAAGGVGISVMQPAFSPDGRWLAYVSDASGWWQLYLRDVQTGADRQLTFALAEHGLPAWGQGQRSYSFTPDSRAIYFVRSQEGVDTLWRVALDGSGEALVPFDVPYQSLGQPAVSPDGRQIAMLASAGHIPPRLIVAAPDGRTRVVRRSTAEELPESQYARPEAVRWPGMDGETVYGMFYAPQSDQYSGVGLPPLVVGAHGGPTGQRTAAFSQQIQFFTSRGYAFLEVNYRGSTGYGRVYRNKLRGAWGIYDVQDCASAATAMADQGRVDRARMVIIGGSAGGFTVLKALEDYPGLFKAGICMYGIANQFTALDTHKFEARYSDSLLGELPEAAAIYRERSPIFFADRIRDAIAIFQGEDDEVVRRDQSDDMVAVLRRQGVPHIYHLYPGEGHGFRKPETIEHFYKTVEQFLRQYVIYT